MIKQRLTDNWEHYRGSLGGVWEVWRRDQLANHYGVPWEAVQLPHCFNASDAVDPGTLYYQGPGWYRTHLAVDNPYPDGRTLLHFEGAGQKTDVYVYTRHLAHHVGGYDEFTVDITDALDEADDLSCYDGRIPVAIRCDNTRDLEMVPSDIADFHLYGGLYRYLNLIYVPPVSLARVHVESALTDSGAAAITVKARLHNPASVDTELDIQVEVTDPQGQRVHTSSLRRDPWNDEASLATFTIDTPSLWSTDRPALYQCAVTLRDGQQDTRAVERFGIRQFEFQKHGPFYLNGQRLLLRGTHRHEDHAGVGAAMTESMIRQEMSLIKAMGCNFIRLGHYQQSRIVLDLCDELGILVFEEIPWCRGGIGGDRYRQQCREMLAAMIDQHYNHPSIIIWGLGNEIDWRGDHETFKPDDIRTLLIELHALSHDLDPSRVTGLRCSEYGKDVVDVYSPSIWAGWYRGIYTEYERYTREAFEEADRFLHLEWGADSLAGRHAETPFTGFDIIKTGQGAEEREGDFMLAGGNPRVALNGDWSESYFCDLIDWYLRAQEQMPWLTGTAQWVFKDFATPVRPHNGLPFVNCKGVVERDLTRKEAYYVFQSYWTAQPMVRIHGHHAPVRWGGEGEQKTVKVHSNCPSVELYCNGVSCGTRQRDPQNFPAAGLHWNLRLEEGENHLKAIGRSGSDVVVDELTFTYQTQPWGEPAELRLEQHPQSDDLLRIHVTAYDAHGTRCLDATNRICFGLTGDGQLIDNLGTVRGAREVRLSNGYACIDVDAAEGQSVVSVRSDGLPTAFITLGCLETSPTVGAAR